MALRPTGERWAVTNEEAGSTALVARLQAIAPQLMVLEATGRSQRAGVAALAAAGLPVGVGKPRHTRAFAPAPGPLAQTEGLEARAVAHCAEAVRPALRPVADAPPEALRALRARRRQRIARRTAAHNRLGSAPHRLQAASAAHIAWLTARLVALADALDTTLRASPVGRERAEWLRRVPGIGPVGARPLILALPEWGTVHRQRLAALVGVAPVPRASGPLRGTRTVWGGRAQVRTTLSMSTLGAVRDNPVLQAFSERLRAAGKAAKVALTACMRKLLTILHAMGQHPTPWQPQEAAIAS